MPENCVSCSALAGPTLGSLNPGLVCGLVPSKEMDVCKCDEMFYADSVSQNLKSSWFVRDHLMLYIQKFSL